MSTPLQIIICTTQLCIFSMLLCFKEAAVGPEVANNLESPRLFALVELWQETKRAGTMQSRVVTAYFSLYPGHCYCYCWCIIFGPCQLTACAHTLYTITSSLTIIDVSKKNRSCCFLYRAAEPYTALWIQTKTNSDCPYN